MEQKITSLCQRLWDKNEAEGIEQSIRTDGPRAREITMIDASRTRPLSPMLEARFDFAYEWAGATLGKTWLGLDRIETALTDPEIRELYDLRVENWARVPPAASEPQDTALFGVDFDDFEETYLVWKSEAPEPLVYTFFGANVKRFLDLSRYLEYLVGDRKEDDNEPSMFSTEGENYKLVDK